MYDSDLHKNGLKVMTGYLWSEKVVMFSVSSIVLTSPSNIPYMDDQIL